MTSPQGNSAKPESPTEIIKIISSLSESRVRYDNLLGRLWKVCDRLKSYPPITSPDKKMSEDITPGIVYELDREAVQYEERNNVLASYVNKLEELI